MGQQTQSADSERVERTIGPPPKADLGLFVYGSLQPNQLAYRQLAHFVSHASDATLDGALWIRDGLPLLVDVPGYRVHGTLLTFSTSGAEYAWRAVREFEPRKYYTWDVALVTTADGQCEANVLRGRKENRSTVQEPRERWSAADDPALTNGLDYVRSQVLSLCPEGTFYDLATDQPSGWTKFFGLQAAYLLLWSIVERCVAFAISANDLEDIGTRGSRFMALPDFESAIRAALRAAGRSGGREVPGDSSAGLKKESSSRSSRPTRSVTDER